MAQENIETYDLVVFLAVARTGSFGAAASTLLVSTPSVSTRIASLERKVGIDLFTRSPRGSRLTPAGEAFRAYAQRCLDILEEAHHTVQLGSRLRMVVAAPASLGATIFAPVLRLLDEADVTGHARVADSNMVIDQLVDGSADVGFVVNAAIPTTITSHRICRSPLLVVGHRRHPLVRRHGVTLNDMLATKVAVYRWSAEAEGLADALTNSRRRDDSPVQLLGLPSSILDLVLHNNYVGIVPEFGAVAALRAGEILEVDLELPRWALDVHMVYLRSGRETKAIDMLVRDRGRIASEVSRDEN